MANNLTHHKIWAGVCGRSSPVPISGGVRQPPPNTLQEHFKVLKDLWWCKTRFYRASCFNVVPLLFMHKIMNLISGRARIGTWLSAINI